ncbi:MAG: insulinase family protein, partial [Candidatus Eremiobacteraeota bacterium]|nr:insulinase family protein [Candidatus Eremiobacteraeota bacterium]
VKNGVPAELVDAAKRSEIASAEYDRNSIDNLASTWSDALAARGRISPDDEINAIRSITVDDVNRVARKYLVPSAAVTAILLPKPSGKAVSSKGFGGGETTTSQPTKAVELPAWAQAKLAGVTVPASTLHPTDTRLPNGIRLIVQPETISDTVSVTGEIQHQDAYQTPPAQEGEGAVLAGLFSYGTTSLDRLAFQKALDDIAADEAAGTNFSLHVLRPDFDRGVQLLADDELHPALPAPDFAIVRTQTAQQLAGEQQSPGYFAQRAVAKAILPPGDPALREATPQTVAAVTLPAIKAYHASVYRPDMTTIVVIGNITPADARATVEKYFGDWKASGPRPKIALPPVPPNKKSAAVVPDASRVQDQTSLVETVPIDRTSPAYYPLELGDHVLGGGFYATRLYHDLRQVAGLVYNVNNVLVAGKTRATYQIEFGSDPQSVVKARQLIARDLHAMQTKNVSPAELEQAKAILLRQLPLAESSENEVAGSLASDASLGLPLDERHRAAQIYANLTAAQVRAAFAKYIRPAGFVQVVLGPQPS